MRKFPLLILFLIWTGSIMFLLSPSSFGQTLEPGAVYFKGSTMESSFGTRPAGHHLPATETTIILNQGKSDCQHDWVSPKPMYTTSMVNAVWRDPDQDQSWELFRICKGCLRHEQIKYFSKWVLNKDEYGELLKKLEKNPK